MTKLGSSCAMDDDDFQTVLDWNYCCCYLLANRTFRPRLAAGAFVFDGDAKFGNSTFRRSIKS